MNAKPHRAAPLEVLHVIDSIGHGGAEQNLLAIVRRLGPEKYRHHLAWLYPDDRLIEKFRPHVATLLPLGISGTRDLPRGATELARWIRRSRPGLIHAQLVRAQVLARCARALAFGPPIVTTWVSPLYDARSLKDFSGSLLRQQVNRLVDMVSGVGDAHFIGVSTQTAELCSTKLLVPDRKVTVINTMLDPERFAPVPAGLLGDKRRALGVPDDALLILSAARLIEQKGHADSIAALTSVLQTHQNAVLLIAGTGPLEALLQGQVAAAGLARNVRFLGYRSDFPALCQMSDLFLFPSHYEGLPVALIEALANGLPAVLSDIPPHREIASGLKSVSFVPPGHPALLAEAVAKTLGKRASAGPVLEESTRRIRHAFSADLLSARFAEVFEQAARRDGGGRGL